MITEATLTASIITKEQLPYAKADSTPKIGIFWLHCHDSIISVFHKVSFPIEYGSKYGDFIIADNPHYETWENLKEQGLIPQSSEYMAIPRGRVLYNRLLQRYKVFTGKWITPPIKKIILSAFNLPQRGVIWDRDSHYDGFKRWSL